MTVRLFDVSRASLVDGPGIRTTFFFKGCNLHCKWCHNPESQKAQPELLFYPEKCRGCGLCERVCASPSHCIACGACAEVCNTGARRLAGKDYEIEELVSIAKKDRAYFESSGGGVTLSGGECLLYPEAVRMLGERLKAEGISVAIDTAGAVPWETFETVLSVTDLFLYDVKCMDDATHREYTGVGNALILSNLRELLKRKARVWIRVPVIPGVNDTEEEMEKLRDFLVQQASKPEKIELLPYHRMGEGKYAALGREVTVFTLPAKERMAALQKILEV